jgi:hypothetical protein
LNIPQASPPIVVDPDNHDYYGNMPSKNTIKQYGGSATLTEQFGDVTAKLVVARQDAKFVVTGDSDGTDLPMLELNSGDQANRQNTAELNFPARSGMDARRGSSVASTFRRTAMHTSTTT